MADGVEVRSTEDAMWASEQVPAAFPSRVRRSLQGLEAHEHASETAWPYGNPTYDEGRPSAAEDQANRRALPPWRPLPDVSLAAVRDELRLGSAVIVSLRVVPGTWHDGTGEIDADANKLAPSSHAVLAVGASDDDEEPERIVVKNSWGPTWGHDGYGFVTRRYLDSYCLWAHVLEG